MTKVEAIECVLKQNGGSANLNTIYEKIQKFYPKARQSSEWWECASTIFLRK